MTAKQKQKSQRYRSLLQKLDFRSPTLLAVMTILILAGIYIVARLQAASVAAFEAEGDRFGSIALVSDGSASGGQYIQFGGVTSTNPPPPTPPPPTPTQPPPPPPVGSGNKCVVGLAGSGGGYGMGSFGSAGYYPQDPSWTTIDTLGNAVYNQQLGQGGWDTSNYATAIAAINRDLLTKQPAGGCGQIIVHGFSAGGGMAGEMACRGETLGGKVIGYMDDDGVGFPSTSCSTGNLHVRVFGCTMSVPNNYYINYFHYGDTPGAAALLGTTVVDKPSSVCNNQTATMWHTPYSRGDYGGALPPEYFSWW